MLEAFEDYWNLDPASGTRGPSHIREAIFRIIPQSQTAIAAFKAGEVDGVLGVGIEDAKELEKNRKHKVYYSNLNTPRFVMIDWKTKTLSNGKPNPFLDVRIRRAMNHAIDIDAVIKNYLTGRERKTTLVGYGALGYTPDVPRYHYDPEKARRLLAEAGYGKGFTTQMMVTQDRPAFMDALVQYWRDIGVDVNYKIVTLPLALRTMGRKKMDGGIVYWRGHVGYDPSIGFFHVTVKQSGRYNQTTPDPEMERLIALQEKEFDEQKRAEIIQKITYKFWEDAWYVPLFESVSIKVIQADKWDYKDPSSGGRNFELDAIRLKK